MRVVPPDIPMSPSIVPIALPATIPDTGNRHRFINLRKLKLKHLSVHALASVAGTPTRAPRMVPGCSPWFIWQTIVANSRMTKESGRFFFGD